jgi:uncharacterized protein YbaR (Trm112 family)
LLQLGAKRPKFLAVMDLTSGYYQAALDEISRVGTAFITPKGLFHWTRVPMGLRGAPSYFQHEINSTVLGGLKEACDSYLDDIIVAGSTAKEFIQNLALTFERLREKNITLNASKCKIGVTQVEYVGHTIDSEGLSFSEKKLNKVRDFVRPKTQGGMKSFLGLTNYFRDHIRLYCQYDSLLQKLVTPYSKNKKLDWTNNPEAAKAYTELINSVIHCNKLYFMEEELPLVLETDACDYGVGAYLYQIKEGIHRPIQFISKVFNPVQLRWGTNEKRRKHMLYSIPSWNWDTSSVSITLPYVLIIRTLLILTIL